MPKKRTQPRSQVQNKTFWLALAIVFIASTITIISNVHETPNLTGNAAVQTIGYFEAGEELYFEIRNVEGLKTARITFADTIKNGKVLTETIDKVSWDFDGEVYSMFTIESPEEAAIDSVELVLKIRESELYDKGISPFDVTLFNNGKALQTTLTKRDSTHATYTVTSQEIGEFIIGREKVVEEPTPQPEEKPAQPPVGKTIQQPTPEPIQEPEKRGFFQKIGDFFRNFLG